jgi:hypothetical protein
MLVGKCNDAAVSGLAFIQVVVINNGVTHLAQFFTEKWTRERYTTNISSDCWNM